MSFPTYDSTAGAISTGTSSGNASHSLGAASGNDRCVLIWCFSRGNSEADTAITSCTYNGSSSGVTLVGTYTSGAGSNVRVTLYRVMDADLPSSSGSYNAACSSSNGQDTGVCAISYEDVDQSDPIGGEYEIGRVSVVDPINDSVTTDTVNSVVVDGCAANLTSGSATTTQSGQTERDDRTAGETLALVSTRPADVTGSWTLGWDFSGGPNRSQHYLVELHSASPGIAFVDIDSDTAVGPSLTLGPTKAEGDLMIAALVITDDIPDVSWSSVPSGWTLYVDDQATGGAPSSPPKLYIWYKRAGASEPSTYTWTGSDSDCGYIGFISAYRNVDETTPFDATRTIATGSSGNIDPTSITTVTADAWVVAVGFHDDNDTITAQSSGYSVRLMSVALDPGASGNGAGLGTCDIDAGAIGAENPGAWTNPTEEWGAVTLALRPAGGAPPAGPEFNALRLGLNT